MPGHLSKGSHSEQNTKVNALITINMRMEMAAPGTHCDIYICDRSTSGMAQVH